MKKNNITLSLALAAVFSSSVAFAEVEVTGKIVHESAKFTTTGTTIGAAAAHGKDAFKTETSARIFIDGAIDELYDGATYHVELQAFTDSKALDDYNSNTSYTQRDALREAYIDTEVNDWSIRAGKQQVVWGTADGMKLLDSINPTDYSEMAQNQMEDSRIPVWMINAETDLEDGTSLQIIASEQKANFIAGMNASGDQGHAFIMKGVDTITGKQNGFLNVTPALAAVASTFNQAATGQGGTGGFQQMPTSFVDPGVYGTWNGSSSSLMPFTGFTVDGFAGNTLAGAGGFDTVTSPGQMISIGQTGAGTNDGVTPANGGASTAGTAGTVASNGYDLLYDMATNGARSLAGDANPANPFANINNGNTTLVNAQSWDIANPTAAFEYMPSATFSTFNTFSGITSFAGAQYVKDSNAQDGINFGARTQNSTADGLNYSFNVLRHADANPFIDLSWHDKTTGEELTVELRQGGDPATGMPLGGTVVYRADVVTSLMSYEACVAVNPAGCPAQPAGMQPYMYGNSVNATTVMIKNEAGEYYGAQDPTGGAAYAGTDNAPVLRYTEKSNDITSIGGSFDTSIETAALGGVVIRGEAMLNIDEMTPIVNRKLLAIGDLTGALTMKKGNTLRYVIGADITAMTNMMISAQIIQIRNLDYVDTACTGTTQMGSSYDCSEYTADMATMHLSNGLNKAEENKEFYSLFFSKPFGASGEHRWNNIFMFEENGGKWNRLDAEFSINDETQVTVEYNKYWGNENTQFGQLEASSNIQAGFKYSF